MPSFEWPGAADLGRGVPWNVLPPYAMNRALLDGGSKESGVLVPLTAQQLEDLRTESRTAISAYCGTQAADGCKELVIVKAVPGDLLDCHGAILQWHHSKLPWRDPKFGPWHVPDRLAGLVAIGVSAPATATLDDCPTLIDEDCVSGATGFPTVATGWIMVGAQVGTVSYGYVYAPTVDALLVCGSDRGSSFTIYGSNDNAAWTVVARSALTGSGYSAAGGIATVAAGHPYGGPGMIALFASPQNYAYYAIAWNNASGAVHNYAEIVPLSKYGDLSVSRDSWTWRGIAIENAPGITVSNSVMTVQSVTRHRYVFPADWPIVMARLKFRAMVMRAADLGDATVDAAGLVRMEVYANPNSVDFVDAAGPLSWLQESAVPGQAGPVVEFAVKNSSTVATTSVQLTVPIEAISVADEPLLPDTTLQDIPHAAANLARTGAILNADGTALGSLGDSSFVLDPIRCPGWIEVDTTPAAPTEFKIHYLAGRIETFAGTALPANTVAKEFKYAPIGCQIAKWSDGATWIGFGESLTFGNGVIQPGEQIPVYAQADMTGRTERGVFPVLPVVTVGF